MNALSAALTLALVHVPLVVFAAILLRLSIPRRFTASRATVSSFGLVCLLQITQTGRLPA